MDSRRLCCRGEGPRLARATPSPPSLDAEAAPAAVGSAVSISFCGGKQADLKNNEWCSDWGKLCKRCSFPLVQSNSITTRNPRVVSRWIFHYFAQHEPIIRILLVERSVYTCITSFETIRLTFVIYLPSVLVPRFDLGLGERQGVGHVASVCHAQILLTAKLSLQVSELGMGERGSPSSGLPAAWRAAARSARLARSRCRRRWRECWRRTFQSGARAASRVDRVLRVRVNGRIVLGIFWKRKYVLSRIRRIDSCWATKSDTISNSCPIRRK